MYTESRQESLESKVREEISFHLGGKIHGGRWSNHTAQIFLTWPSVSSCERHGCHPLEKFTTERER